MAEAGGVKTVRMPKWGLSMQEGTLLRWNVKVGDHVDAGAPLCDIETTKITNEFESPDSGTVARLLAEPDDVVMVGRVIAILAGEDASQSEIDAAVALDAASERAAPASEEVGLQFVETPNGRLAYLEGGERSAATIVFLHGFGGDHANWTLNQGALSTRNHTIAFDLPGHGESEATLATASPDEVAVILRDAVTALGLERVHLVAHSFGAALALRMVEAAPAQYRSATLIAPLGLGIPANPDYVSGFLRAQRKRDMKPVMEMLFADPRLVGREMVNSALQARRDPAAREVLARLAAGMSQIGGDPGSLPAAMPLQIIWGDQDRIVPLAPDLAQALGNRLHLVVGAGHMPQVEKPDATDALIAAFIEV